jgi:hypothetical protein
MRVGPGFGRRSANSIICQVFPGRFHQVFLYSLERKTNKKFIGSKFLSLLFVLTQKVTKKSRRFPARLRLQAGMRYFLLVRSFPLPNRQWGESFKSKGSRTKTLLRAIGGFPEALYCV